MSPKKKLVVEVQRIPWWRAVLCFAAPPLAVLDYGIGMFLFFCLFYTQGVMHVMTVKNFVFTWQDIVPMMAGQVLAFVVTMFIKPNCSHGNNEHVVDIYETDNKAK